MKSFNPEAVLKQFDNDIELFRTVVEQLNVELPKYIKQLTTACETKNWSEVHKIAHKIHGAAANFLENPVREIAKQMEVLSQRNQTEGLFELSKHLEAQAKYLLAELNKLTGAKAAS